MAGRTTREIMDNLMELADEMGFDGVKILLEELDIAIKNELRDAAMENAHLPAVCLKRPITRNCDRFDSGDVKKDAQAALEAYLDSGVCGYRAVAEWFLSPVKENGHGGV